MRHQITTNHELELTLDGPELLAFLTTTEHLDGPFGGAYRFDEIATHGWHLTDATILDDAIDTEVRLHLTLVRADVSK